MAGILDRPIFDMQGYRDIEECEITCDDSLLKQIEKAILFQNRHDFVRLVNELPSDELDEELTHIRASIMTWNSPECAAAVLDGETKITKIPCLTPWLLQLDNGLLHRAASSAAYKVAALLLRRGFSADVRADFDKFKAALPLDIVMSKICCCFVNPRGCTPVEAVLRLFESSMRGKLETLRVIALNTRDVKPMFLNYLKEGMVREVAALLMVARSRVLSSSTSTAKGEFRSISEMHDFVSNAKCLLSTSATAGDKNKLVEMEEILVLLKIFDKIGNKLAALLRLDLTAFNTANRCCSSYVAEALIQAAGFDVTPKFVNSNNSSTRDAVVKIVSSVLEGCVDESNKAALTTDVLPGLVNEAALRGLGDKSGNIFRLPFSFGPKPPPYILGTVRKLSTVSLSPLSSRSVPMLVDKPLLQRLVKKMKASTFLGTIARITSLRR